MPLDFDQERGTVFIDRQDLSKQSTPLVIMNNHSDIGEPPPDVHLWLPGPIIACRTLPSRPHLAIVGYPNSNSDGYHFKAGSCLDLAPLDTVKICISEGDPQTALISIRSDRSSIMDRSELEGSELPDRNILVSAQKGMCVATFGAAAFRYSGFVQACPGISMFGVAAKPKDVRELHAIRLFPGAFRPTLDQAESVYRVLAYAAGKY